MVNKLSLLPWQETVIVWPTPEVIKNPQQGGCGVWQREIELQVGDAIRIGSQCLVVVEVLDDEVVFKICDEQDENDGGAWSSPAPPK